MKSYAKTSRGRGKSGGWATIGLKQCQEQPQLGSDPFPPLHNNSTTSLLPSPSLPIRSFSSVVQSSADFPPVVENLDSGPIDIKELQQLHCWSDGGLIEDVLANVNNDTDKAAALLREMAPSCEEKCRIKQNQVDFESKEGGKDKSLLERTSDLAADIAELSCTLEDALRSAPQESVNLDTAQAKTATANMKLILGHLKSLPTEPEWEENDAYLSHRRDALKMTRLASRHSRAATNAFIRGDHFTAQQQSMKARKEWLDAERLNSKAAKEILSLRNSEDNPWKFDLHGLHASEAVRALQEHLQKIETLLPMNRQLAPVGLNTNNGISSKIPVGCMNLENANAHSTRPRQRPASIQVITGIGNHSRGQASLPAAVRFFLVENRYRFDETRPGVITVYPKFHHR